MANLGVVGLGLAAAASADGNEWARYAQKLERELDIMQSRQRAALGVIRNLRSLSQRSPDQVVKILQDQETLHLHLRHELVNNLSEFGISPGDLTPDEMSF